MRTGLSNKGRIRNFKKEFWLVRVYYGLDRGYIYKLLPSRYTFDVNQHSLFICNEAHNFLMQTVGSKIDLIDQKPFDPNFSTREEIKMRVVYLLHYERINVTKVGESGEDNILNRVVSQAPDFVALLVKTYDHETANRIEEFVENEWSFIRQNVSDKERAENVYKKLKSQSLLADFGFGSSMGFDDFVYLAEEIAYEVAKKFNVLPVIKVFKMRYHTINNGGNMSGKKIDIVTHPANVPRHFKVLGAWGEILLVRRLRQGNNLVLLNVKTLRNFTFYMWGKRDVW